jgi:HEAT repeat protein
MQFERAVAFVAEYLNAQDEAVRDEAALALGASRLPSAVNVLIEAWNQTRDPEFGGVLLRALSSSREQEALDFLLDLVRSGAGRESALALDALKLHEHSPEIQAQIELAKKQR